MSNNRPRVQSFPNLRRLLYCTVLSVTLLYSTYPHSTGPSERWWCCTVSVLFRTLVVPQIRNCTRTYCTRTYRTTVRTCLQRAFLDTVQYFARRPLQYRDCSPSFAAYKTRHVWESTVMPVTPFWLSCSVPLLVQPIPPPLLNSILNLSSRASTAR